MPETYQSKVIAVHILGLVTTIIDGTMVNVALPTMVDDFGVPTTDIVLELRILEPTLTLHLVRDRLFRTIKIPATDAHLIHPLPNDPPDVLREQQRTEPTLLLTLTKG